MGLFVPWTREGIQKGIGIKWEEYFEEKKNDILIKYVLENFRTGYRWQLGESGGLIDSCQRSTEQFGTVATGESGGLIDSCQRTTEQFGTIATRESGGYIGSCQRSTEQFSERDIGRKGKRWIN